VERILAGPRPADDGDEPPEEEAPVAETATATATPASGAP